MKDRKFFTSSQLKGQIIKFYSAFIDLYLILGVGTWLVVVYGITKVIINYLFFSMFQYLKQNRMLIKKENDLFIIVNKF